MGPATTDTGTVLSAAHAMAATDGTPGAGTSARAGTEPGTTDTATYFISTATAAGNFPTTTATVRHTSPASSSEHERPTPPG